MGNIYNADAQNQTTNIVFLTNKKSRLFTFSGRNTVIYQLELGH